MNTKNVCKHGVVQPWIIALLTVSGCYGGVAAEAAETDETDGASGATDSPADDPGGDVPSGESTGGDDPAQDPAPQGCQAIEEAALATLEANCSGCHGAAGQGPGGFADALDVPAMIANGQIVPGDAEASPLWVRANTGAMPPAGVEPRPSDGALDVLGQWIDECVAPTSCEHDEFIGLESQLLAMRDDANDLDPTDRPFLRYITITHVYNTGLCGESLDPQRFALAKALNSLSTDVDVMALEPVDAERTIFRLDIRDYGWTPALWETITRANPYAVSYASDAGLDLREITQTDVPSLMSDAFVVEAMQPPLYHEIVGIPANRSELEASLGIDVAFDIEEDDARRSGFADSGVSVNNRLIERHVQPSSSSRIYWLSYDFASSGGFGNIFAHPLDFQAAGNEVIFSLPNGLHAYMITDALGNRLDAAPDDIVTDPAQPDGNVVNGISCMGCHTHGVIEREDELREYVSASFDFDQPVKDKVAELHPDQGTLMALKEFDRDNYTAALGMAGVPSNLNYEPVNKVFADFDGDVDLATAAAALGVSTATLEGELGGLSPDLQALASGPIKREVFTLNYAQAACDLFLGQTTACGLQTAQCQEAAIDCAGCEAPEILCDPTCEALAAQCSG